jgi:signal transduction histidine kinase
MLEGRGCPLAQAVKECLRFETLLADLMATFVNVHANQVASPITAGLRQIVEFLGIDRSELGQLVPGENQLLVTHSYQVPGVPPAPRVILEDRFPTFARRIRKGEAFWLPDDIRLPDDAAAEREYLARSGLKSQLTIPLKAAGAVVGAIGFASFRSRVEWSDELVQRLRLIGDIFTSALARQQADEALRAREQSLRQAEADLRALASKLLTAQEEERRRVAREMHDDWTPRLAVLGLKVARLEKSVGEPAVAVPLLRTMQEELVALSEDVHALSRQLHPSILDDLGLVEALRSECSAFSRREQIAVAYLAEGVPRRVPKDLARCVYRVAQEALRNLARHAAVTASWPSASPSTCTGRCTRPTRPSTWSASCRPWSTSAPGCGRPRRSPG